MTDIQWMQIVTMDTDNTIEWPISSNNIIRWHTSTGSRLVFSASNSWNNMHAWRINTSSGTIKELAGEINITLSMFKLGYPVN